MNTQEVGCMADDETQDIDGEDPELFPLGTLEGDEFTAQQLVKRGLPVEVTVALSSAEVPTTSGLFDPNKVGRALVSYEPAKVEMVPQREEGHLKGWKARQHLRVLYVVQATDSASLIRQEFAALLVHSAQDAGRLLDALHDQAGAALSR